MVCKISIDILSVFCCSGDTVHVDVRLNSIEVQCCGMSPSAYMDRLLRFSVLFFKAHLSRLVHSYMYADFFSTRLHAARLPLRRKVIFDLMVVRNTATLTLCKEKY